MSIFRNIGLFLVSKALAELVVQAYKHSKYNMYFQMFFVFAVDRERICRSAQLWSNFASIKDNGSIVFSGSR